MPPTLLHHAACEIAPAMHNGPPRVLVVGGVVRDHDMGEPVFMSANEGLVLEGLHILLISDCYIRQNDGPEARRSSCLAG